MADNVDYWRVMRPAGIGHVEPLRRPGEFVRCEFALAEPQLETGVSSPSLLAWLARSVSSPFEPLPGQLDLRQMGLVYLVLTGVVVAGLLWSGASPVLVAAWLFVVVDPGYLLFYNSFYADPALLLALLGIAGWLTLWSGAPLRCRPSARGIGGRVALVALVLLGGFSKMQYMVLPAVTLVALGSLWRCPLDPRPESAPTREKDSSAPLLLSVLLVLAAAAPYHFYRGPAPRFLEVNNYHAVFAGILQVAEEPGPILASLGVPERFRGLPRRDIWSARVPLDHPVHERLESLSRWRLLGLYLARPPAVAGAAKKVQETLAAFDTHRRGSFTRGTGHRRWEQYCVPWQFSRPRTALLQVWPPLLWVILASAAAWCGVTAAGRRWNGRAAAALFLLLFVLSQLVVVVLGDGFVALEQHLVGARLALDLLIVLLVFESVSIAAQWLRSWLRKRGASHSPPTTAP